MKKTECRIQNTVFKERAACEASENHETLTALARDFDVHAAALTSTQKQKHVTPENTGQ